MSSKVLEQHEFLKDVAKLIYFAEQQGFMVTGGDLWRSNCQQLLYVHGKEIIEIDGKLEFKDVSVKSETTRSKHLERLAIDLNFFLRGVLTYKKSDIKILGDYWESINKSKTSKNVWGGNFRRTDTPHFQRSV